jgi:hypothetical protein
MNRKFVLSVVIIAILLVGLVAFISYAGLSGNGKEKKPFLVGVTFGGNNTQDAKTLIDKVANYTNLFVLQSGELMRDKAAVMEIGDYAVSCGLHFAAFFESGTLFPAREASWLGFAEERWGSMFAGVYYGDELGGKVLDTYVVLEETIITGQWGTATTPKILKNAVGGLTYYENGSSITYQPNGEIVVVKSNTITYYPNGTITLIEDSDIFTIENGTDRIAQEETYEQVLSKNPIPDCDAAAKAFTSKNREKIANLSSQWQLSNRSFPIFTADYALYWWNYQSGYDMVLAELGWNNTVAQEIGLVRGAANLQGKRWGTILTWKYTNAPYLTGGDEMFEQMKTSYECGAEYVVVFNYAEDMEGPYGTLQEEHFEALERFWNEVVQNPNVVHGGVKAEAALVLPRNYGWGMRNPNDIIWGLWNANGTSQQIWSQLQGRLAQYGTKLDIVYEDGAYPVAGKYDNIYYWNQIP